MVNVEIVYVPTNKKVVRIAVTLQPGATVGDALNQSGLLDAYPEVKEMAVGIFAQQVSLDTLVKTGDRIEIYRPLLLDPKEKRRERARQS